jgi:hypothetical protein
MKKLLLPMFAAALALTSCSSVFKSGQTPDDVYYSHGANLPVREDRQASEENADGYQSYWADSDDSYLRMKVRDRDRWGTIDDVNYWYGYNDPRSMWNTNWISFGMGNMWASPWYNPWNTWNNPWAWGNAWNSWNNPWCWNRPVVGINKYPTTVNAGNMRSGNYNYSGFNNSLFDRGRTNGTKYNVPSGSGNANSFRSIFRNSGSGGEGGTISRPGRYFDNNSSSGSGRSSSGMGSSSSGGSSRTSSGSSGSSSSSSGGGRAGRGG